jgi:hypothetical protein
VSKTARPLRLVDSDLTPAWDVTFSIRGVDVPMRSPSVVAAEGDDGLIVGFLRMLWPGAWTRKLRRDCLAIATREFAPLIRSLTVAEMQMLSDRYEAVQVAWLAEASGRAMRMASESFAAPGAGEGFEGPVKARHSPIERVSNALVSIRPGEPLPGWCNAGSVFGLRRDANGNPIRTDGGNG